MAKLMPPDWEPPYAAYVSDIAESRRRHLTVELPDNLCFIRTVQGWANCLDEKRAYFLKHTYQVYLGGIKFLQPPPPRGQLHLRPTGHRHGGRPATTPDRVHRLVLSLTDLENWVWNHPTHAAIFDAMLTHSKRFNFDVQVLLGHEVLVVPKAGLRAEYHNCHDTTGFLPFFDATDL